MCKYQQVVVGELTDGFSLQKSSFPFWWVIEEESQMFSTWHHLFWVDRKQKESDYFRDCQVRTVAETGQAGHTHGVGQVWAVV